MTSTYRHSENFASPIARRRMAAAIGLALAAGATGAIAQSTDGTAAARGPKPFTLKIIKPTVAAATAGTVEAAGTVTPQAQTLSAPVTLNANTGVDALTVTQIGPGRAINGVVNRPGTNAAAVRGQHNGIGAAVYGLNTGTTGPAGKFESNNATSGYPALQALHPGLGNALQAVITNTTANDTPAVLGQHLLGPANWGIGVEGDGKYVGVKGVGYTGGLTGVWGVANGGLYAGYFSGNVYTEGSVFASSFPLNSDRNLKDGITPIDGNEVLDKIAAMPISAWHYKDSAGERHIGPMAQDFRAAFGLGKDDRHIEMVDLGGVSLAAVQALKRQVDAKDARIAQLESQLASLNATIDGRLAALEQAAHVAGTTAPATAAASDQR